jgi:hypothetical protein
MGRVLAYQCFNKVVVLPVSMLAAQPLHDRVGSCRLQHVHL